MINYYNGDLLKSNCDIIAHQVNMQGVMGGGLALQIATQYPYCEKNYKWHLKITGKKIFGMVYLYQITKNKWIANNFTQKENFETDYEKVKTGFESILEFAKDHKLKTIGVPYKYGCGIAKGNWKVVEAILKQIFEKEKDIELQVWKFNKIN